MFGAASESMDETAFLWKDPDETFAKIKQSRLNAKKAWLEEIAADNMSRAQNAKSRKVKQPEVRRRVYYHRPQGKSFTKGGDAWRGPATVVLIETRQPYEKLSTKAPGPDGPASVVWLAHGAILIRCVSGSAPVAKRPRRL